MDIVRFCNFHIRFMSRLCLSVSEQLVELCHIYFSVFLHFIIRGSHDAYVEAVSAHYLSVLALVPCVLILIFIIITYHLEVGLGYGGDCWCWHHKRVRLMTIHTFWLLHAFAVHRELKRLRVQASHHVIRLVQLLWCDLELVGVVLCEYFLFLSAWSWGGDCHFGGSSGCFLLFVWFCKCLKLSNFLLFCISLLFLSFNLFLS